MKATKNRDMMVPSKAAGRDLLAAFDLCFYVMTPPAARDLREMIGRCRFLRRCDKVPPAG